MSASSVKTIALAGKNPTAGMSASLSALADFLVQAGHAVLLDAETARTHQIERYPAFAPSELGRRADVAIVVGGDGTMLGLARQLAPYPVPLIGINQGRLGFITDIPLEGMIEAVSAILSGDCIEETRSLLEATVIREERCIFSGLAFNDIVVARGSGSGMVELRVDVDDRFMYNQRSDGLIVSTPTGSSAYALSAGGPLLHPSVEGMSIVPIAPHALSNRPIVLPDSCRIMIEIVAGRDASVNFDMQNFASLMRGDRIHVCRSAHTVTFLHPANWNYFHTLREKLHWNEYPSAEGALR